MPEKVRTGAQAARGECLAWCAQRGIKMALRRSVVEQFVKEAGSSVPERRRLVNAADVSRIERAEQQQAAIRGYITYAI